MTIAIMPLMLSSLVVCHAACFKKLLFGLGNSKPVTIPVSLPIFRSHSAGSETECAMLCERLLFLISPNTAKVGPYMRKQPTVRQVRDLPCGDTRIFLEIEVRRVRCRSCGKVKRERLDFLADNPLYTKRFAPI